MRWTDEENVTHACRVLDNEVVQALRRGADSFKIDDWTTAVDDDGIPHTTVSISLNDGPKARVPDHSTLCGRVCDAVENNEPITCFRCLRVIDLTGPLDEKGVPWISV